MGESIRRRRAPSSENTGTSVPRKLRAARISKFGRHVMLCAGGIKPANWLAGRAGCTERHANLIIAGKRKPNARAALAVYAEIIG